MRVKVSTGEIFNLLEISQMENISLNPEGDPDLSLLGYEKFTEIPMPKRDDADVTLDGAELVDGKWRTKWVIAPFSSEELALLQRGKAKAERRSKVDSIKVTISTGKTLDGDEISQGRMARAIAALRFLASRLAANSPIDLAPFNGAYTLVNGIYSTVWVLANNTDAYLKVEELEEALALSGATQASIWVV